MGSRPLETAEELYREIRERGLHLRKGNGRDDALLEQLRRALGCPDNRIMRHLQRTGMPAQVFLKAFLVVAEPFALMFQEIWEYLARIGAPRAGESIRVRFGFDRDNPTEVELEQFRVWAETVRRVVRQVTSSYWSRDAMHALFELAGLARGGQVLETTRRWEVYRPGRRYRLLDLALPTDGFERLVSRVHRLFQSIIDGYAEIREGTATGRRVQELRDPGELDAEGEDLRHAAVLLTDLLPGWAALFDRVQEVPGPARQAAQRFFDDEIRPKLGERPEQQVLRIREALDVLELPFWAHRWHTYEVWATVATLQCMDDLRPRPRVEDGRVPIDGYQAGIVADLSVRSFDDACVVLQLETPFRRGKRRAIRPDLSVCFDDRMTSESRAVVVEFKQRARLSGSHVLEIGTAYRDGSPRASGVLIVNYDEPELSLALPGRVSLIQGLQPARADSRERFRRELAAMLLRANLVSARGLTVLLLDVSGSMGGRYTPPQVQKALREALGLSWVTILRFSVGLSSGGDLNEGDLPGLTTDGGTDLAAALEQVVDHFGLPETLVVVTDGGYGDPGGWMGRIPNVLQCEPEGLSDALDWLRHLGQPGAGSRAASRRPSGRFGQEPRHVSRVDL